MNRPKPSERAGEALGDFGLGAAAPVHVDRQADHDALDVVLAHQRRELGQVLLLPAALEHVERIGDRRVGVGQCQPDPAAAEVDPEDSHGPRE